MTMKITKLRDLGNEYMIEIWLDDSKSIPDPNSPVPGEDEKDERPLVPNPQYLQVRRIEKPEKFPLVYDLPDGGMVKISQDQYLENWVNRLRSEMQGILDTIRRESPSERPVGTKHKLEGKTL